MAGFRLTTKVQVSGWRFLLRRVEHAIVRRDTRMFDDPLQFYSRAVGAGMVIAVLICLGAALLAYFKPLGKRSGDTLLVDRTTNQLYVMLPDSDRLRPVYNLTSARLVLGNPADPAVVKSDELNRLPKGQPIGIPGAPYATPVAGSGRSTWTLCDTVTKPESVAPRLESAIIALPPVTEDAIGPMRANQGMLVSHRGATWLVTAAGRHAVDLADRAVTSAVGIPVTARPTPISAGLFNALPNAGPWQLPAVPHAGAPNTLGLPGELVIGSVFKTVADDTEQHYVVLPDGVARVNRPTAAALRARDSHGLVAPPAIEPSAVAGVREDVFTSPLPDEPLQLQHRDEVPTLCWSWQREAGDTAPRTAVLSGRRLPLDGAALGTGIDQIGGDATVYIDGGRYVRLQAPDPRHGESLYYIDPQGVRYGIPDEQAAAALGLHSPVYAPWPAVGLLVDGPVLSAQAALLEHDTLPADPHPRRVGPPRGAGS